MPRGSKPGERRGGRQRATPNRRTVLANRILAIAADNPACTLNDLVLALAKDQGLPADVRMAVARKASLFSSSRSIGNRSVALNGRGGKPETKAGPDRSKADAKAAKAGLATDLLFSIVHDTAAKAADRRKAALSIAEFFLPKDTRGMKSRRGKIPPDECGFVVDLELAKELRDSQLKLACLKRDKRRTPYAFAQEARNLHARIAEIHRSLQCSCPSKYGLEQVKNDHVRLRIFADRRLQRKLLLLEEDREEACLTARHDSFVVGPEMMARRRLATFRSKKRVAQADGPRLTAAEETMFRFLTLLYPSPPGPTPSKEMIEDHPFSTGWPYPYIVGNPNYPEPES